MTFVEAHGPPTDCNDCPSKATLSVHFGEATQELIYMFSGLMPFEVLQTALRKDAFGFVFYAAGIGDDHFTLRVETDREALVALYNATNGENWFRSDYWLSDAPLGEWYGVTTNDDRRVIELDLSTNNLSGKIPPWWLGSLSNLKQLVLTYNRLSGEIPAELGSLSNLKWLHLHSNELSGEIPAELGSLSNLESLSLGDNNLSGCVPSSLEDQLNFDASYLGDLPFCGTGSAETDREALVALYKATNDENWFESDNWLSDAPIGEWYGVVTNDDGRVVALVLNFNGLSGEILAKLVSLFNLRELDLSTNNLSGKIPPWWLGSLSNLKQLVLTYNRLSGEIPAELGSLSNLKWLHLHSNELSGEIPAELGSLSNLEYLVLHSNELSGCVPSSLEDQLDSSYDFLGGLPFC